ncbi:MAG: hypothetical protein RBR67_03285 [Desulfobacterium sp.]|jgi:hypothetical protein|nr:hypothetical protein [Desulfobacterium sp.]
MLEQSLFYRTKKFILILSIAFAFVYGLLPLLTDSFDILNRMSLFLEKTEIDPTRYYYTDVEQVIESEQYLRTVL